MDTITAAGTNGNAKGSVLYMALELSQSRWVLAFGTGSGRKRRVGVDGGDLVATLDAIAKAKERLGLKDDAAVRSCHEAGRDGFWVDRWLRSEGIESLVVDSSSIEVNRRARRAKTDRLDAEKLLEQLKRWHGGEQVWKVVRVPSAEAEDARRPDREWGDLKEERTRHIGRIRGLLATKGVRLVPRASFLKDLAEARQWNGEPVPSGLREELEFEYRLLETVEERLRELDRKRKTRLRAPQDASDRKAAGLVRLKGIGEIGASLLAKEAFGWRTFQNRREVGAFAGMTGTPYQSGGGNREQGISKAGNKRVRAMMIQLAWRWLRWQETSRLTLWFLERFARGGSRSRRVGIVALARRLLIALWHYVEHGTVPEGAVFSAPPAIVG
jgi:transposase